MTGVQARYIFMGRPMIWVKEADDGGPAMPPSRVCGPGTPACLGGKKPGKPDAFRALLVHPDAPIAIRQCSDLCKINIIFASDLYKISAIFTSDLCKKTPILHPI